MYGLKPVPFKEVGFFSSLLEPKLNCHLDRSAAKWRDLRFSFGNP